MKVDMHVHTKASRDSDIEPADLVERAKEVGLDGLAVTDHDSLESVEEAKSLSEDLEVISGVEVSVEEGEVLGFFVDKNIEARDIEGAVEEIKSKGGIAVVPHPFDSFRGLENLEGTSNIDGVEVLNSRSLFSKNNERAREYAGRRGLIKTAGSDAHTLGELGGAYVEAEAEYLDGFREKLMDREVEIKGSLNSPLYHALSTFNKVKSSLRE